MVSDVYFTFLWLGEWHDDTAKGSTYFKTEWLTTEMHILRTAGRMLVSYSTDTKKYGGDHCKESQPHVGDWKFYILNV